MECGKCKYSFICKDRECAIEGLNDIEKFLITKFGAIIKKAENVEEDINMA